jgi:hypothetical protein
MSVLTNLIVKSVEDGRQTIEGKTLTRPQLIYTDGVNSTYGVDVDIGREGVINANGDVGILPLYNVPIAANSRDVIYAEVGSAVTLSKSTTGQWQVVGFSKTYPGTYRITCVTLPDYCLRVPNLFPPGPPIYHPIIIGEESDITIGSRLLTYEELGICGSYGSIPYGARTKLTGGGGTGCGRGGDDWTYNPLFSWDPLELADGYYVDYQLGSSTVWTRKDVGDVTQVYISTLGWKPGQTIRVLCVAYWADEEAASGRAVSLHSEVLTYT